MRRVAAAAALVWLAVLGRPSATGAHTTSTGLATLAVSGSTLSYRLTVLPDELPAEAGIRQGLFAGLAVRGSELTFAVPTGEH
jgi:hypothetical protein